MKKLLLLLFVTCAFAMNAQTYRWPNGAMTTAASVTLATKVTTVTPISVVNTKTYMTWTTDTSIVLRATINSSIKAGAELYVVVINGATGATRTVTGSTGITMASYAMTSAKSHMLSFIYDGTNYVNTGVIKIN